MLSSAENYSTHTILRPEDCECDGSRYCSFCDGGLALCIVCGGGEIDLERESCGELLNQKKKDENKVNSSIATSPHDAFADVARKSLPLDLSAVLQYADYLEEHGEIEQPAIVRWAASVAHDCLFAWLQQCAEGGYRYAGLSEPFVKNGYIYATDSRIAIRIRTLACETPPLEGRVPDVERLFADIRNVNVDDTVWKKWPAEPVAVSPPVLDMVFELDCPICYGEGHYYADGDQHTCVYCDGAGSVSKLPVYTRIGDQPYAGRYWSIISQLPGVMFCEPQVGSDSNSGMPGPPYTALYFRFMGGEGILMPIDTGTWQRE